MATNKVSWLTKYLRSNTPESSVRLNMLITIVNYLPIGLVLAWGIWYQILYSVTGLQGGDIAEIIFAMAALYGVLFGTKALNQAQENKASVIQNKEKQDDKQDP